MIDSPVSLQDKRQFELVSAAWQNGPMMILGFSDVLTAIRRPTIVWFKILWYGLVQPCPFQFDPDWRNPVWCALVRPEWSGPVWSSMVSVCSRYWQLQLTSPPSGRQKLVLFHHPHRDRGAQPDSRCTLTGAHHYSHGGLLDCPDTTGAVCRVLPIVTWTGETYTGRTAGTTERGGGIMNN